jgi:hypothetical protein
MKQNIRFIILLFLFFLVFPYFSCEKKCNAIKFDDVHLLPEQNFLNGEHNKKIVLYNKNNDIIDSEDLRENSDYKCNSVLFESDNFFVITDCDGRFFKIEKECAFIIQMEENEFKLEDYKYIGYFKYIPMKRKYEFFREKINLGDEIFKIGGSWERKF